MKYRRCWVGAGQEHCPLEPVPILTPCQEAEHAAICRGSVFWLLPENGFCLMVNPSADLMLSAKDGAASLLLCRNASTFTIQHIATASICLLLHWEAI